MRVLWFSWRDIKHPDSGGAEIFSHHVMKGLVNKCEYDVTLFTAHYQNSLKYENLDGVKISRRGGKYTVYNAAKRYFKKYSDSFDVVIDEINVKPFLTPQFVKHKPILALVHEVPGDALIFQLHFPMNYVIRYYLIRQWLSYYKNIQTVTVSESTMRELKNIGLQKILLVPVGLNIKPLTALPTKELKPTIVFIGRLKRYKLADHAIQAFSLIKKEIPEAKMWIIGDGNMRKHLEKLTVKDVVFFGRVDEELKYDLLSKAHLALMPSVHEGWGLVVTECNAMATPVVAYNVAGLRDSVKDAQTGILVKENSPEGLSRSAISLLKDHDLLTRYSINALAFSRQFNWDNTVSIFDKIIRNMITSFAEHKL